MLYVNIEKIIELKKYYIIFFKIISERTGIPTPGMWLPLFSLLGLDIKKPGGNRVNL